MRSCYTTSARFFDDEAAPIVKMRWYRCAPGAKMMPFPSRFASLNWDGEPWTRQGVGEVFSPYPKPWSAGATPPSALGIAPCGTPAQFQGGAVYDPLANYPRDNWGLLTACGNVAPGQLGGGEKDVGGLDRPIAVVRGGFRLGGRAETGDVVRVRGGFRVGGRAEASSSVRVRGGFRVGGNDLPCLDVAGGFRLGGDELSRAVEVDGGFEVGGVTVPGSI